MSSSYEPPDLPIHTPQWLRYSWAELHLNRADVEGERRERAIERMRERAKAFGITLPEDRDA